MDILRLLKLHEGYRGEVYKCTSGCNTIGYGYNLDVNPLALSRKVLATYAKEGMKEPDAERLLVYMINIIKVDLNTYFDWYKDLSEDRQAVLIDMSYNMGTEGLFKFKKTLALIAQKEYELAAAQMLCSKWAKQVKSRAIRLSKMMAGRYA